MCVVTKWVTDNTDKFRILLSFFVPILRMLVRVNFPCHSNSYHDNIPAQKKKN